MTLLHIRSAEVLCPATGLTGVRDLWVEDGVLRLDDPGGEPDRVIDASGLTAVPGFVEIHAHLREPGFEVSETIATGLSAALIGGYTAVFAMANTRPVNDIPAITRSMLEAARAADSPVRLYPVSAATVGFGGREVADYGAQRTAGAAAVSDDGLPIADDDVMARCMAAAAAAGMPILDHATHGPESGRGVVHEGRASRTRGLPGLPREEEDDLVARHVGISRETGHPLHICHISTEGGVEIVRRAREAGAPVTAEAAPHHLLLTDRDAGGPDHKMNPPLREARDRLAVVRALADGTISAVATDHAPHAPASKRKGMHACPFGVIGMEAAFAALFTDLVIPGAIGLGRLVSAMTVEAARIGRVPGGTLRDGERAEVNLLELETPFLLEPTLLRSRSRNCPFLGRRLRGRVAATVAGSRLAVHDVERIRSSLL